MEGEEYSTLAQLGARVAKNALASLDKTSRYCVAKNALASLDKTSRYCVAKNAP
jgi:hypothetical protein